MNKVLATLGSAAIALSVSATASHAAYLLPGETMGVALTSPVPEGVFAVDLESYGQSDAAGAAHVGVNIPVLLWSTPWTFYNTRLEFLVAVPFAHVDNIPGTPNQVGAITYALGPIFAHDFGNGLTGGFSAFVRTPDPSANIKFAPLFSGRTQVEADIRAGLSYTVAGFTFTETSWYTGNFGNTVNNTFFVNDAIGIDFSATKKFDKLEVGVVGYATTDIENRGKVFGPAFSNRTSQVEIGGLLGYDFGRFTVQGMVTRSVLNRAPVNIPQETRGWLRVIVPLYVAPAPPPLVRARY